MVFGCLAKFDFTNGKLIIVGATNILLVVALSELINKVNRPLEQNVSDGHYKYMRRLRSHSSTPLKKFPFP